MGKDMVIRVGGEGGEGVISTGDMLAQASARAGLEVLTFRTFPAEIKGGYAMYQLRVSTEKILSQGDTFHVCVVFNGEAYEMNKDLLAPGTVLVYDSPGGDFQPEATEGVIQYPVPMTKISKVDLGSPISKNMVALGAVMQLFSFPVDSLKDLIKAKFKKKGESVVEMNLRALEAGAEYVRSHLKKVDRFYVQPAQPREDRIMLSGNEAIGLGALVAGCRFFSCYPITPATDIANWLSRHLPKVNGVVVQAEDEIASLGQVIGATFAGVKAMTGTSGPGLDLMVELLGFASMAELPLVIADVQRGGPSTGLPTKSEQSDLFLAAKGGHGDFPRIVLAAATIEDCFYLTIEAFNLAERYQIPVILLSDGALASRTEKIKRPDLSKIRIINREAYSGGGEYQRYAVTETGVSPVSIPGQDGGRYIATGLEHSETAAPKYSPDYHEKMTEKRFRKIAALEDESPETECEGDKDGDLGIISWGLTQCAVREAMKECADRGLRVRALYPKLVFPVPVKAIQRFASTVKKVLIPELNYQGQFAELVAVHAGVNAIRFNLYGGLPFTPAQIREKITEVIK
ncbi:MAG: 2-oxoacid:acceptor oxidoreductase subunit alpha [Nitrospirae bacterium]|nr:2-oxoacid:acceptor oxidoreductase subunit alpha [Nitrospirota bacterium]